MPNRLSYSRRAGVIPLQMTGEHRGLVDQVGVEASLIAEAGLGRV